jgi:cysteine desulfurase
MSALAQPPAGLLAAAGGQPIAAATLQAWRTAAESSWADPGQLHHAARQAGLLLDAARSSIAQHIGVSPTDLYFTGSGTAALQAAINGVLRAHAPGRLVISAVEPLATFDVADHYETLGGLVSVLPVDGVGRADLQTLAELLGGGDVVAVCLQAANAEVGTRQPIAAAHALTRAAKVPLIVDATGVIGHDVIPEHWDLLTADARDWAGPAGVGILAVRPGTQWLAPYGSARGWLGGLPNIPAAVAAATALETVAPEIGAQAERHRALVHQIRQAVAGEDIDVVGDPVDRLPHVLTFSALFVNGEAIVTELDRRGYAVASGSACVVDSDRASHVLAAMGALTGGNVRITLPYNCTDDTVAGFLGEWPEALAAVRAEI